MCRWDYADSSKGRTRVECSVVEIGECRFATRRTTWRNRGVCGVVACRRAGQRTAVYRENVTQSGIGKIVVGSSKCCVVAAGCNRAIIGQKAATSLRAGDNRNSAFVPVFAEGEIGIGLVNIVGSTVFCISFDAIEVLF